MEQINRIIGGLGEVGPAIIQWLREPVPYSEYPWAAVVGLVVLALAGAALARWVALPWARRWWRNETIRPGEDERGVSTDELTQLQHLLELRTRLMWAIGTLVVTTIVAFPFFRFWFYLAVRPIMGRGSCPASLSATADPTAGAYARCLQAISPTELIFAYFQVTLVVGVALAIPMIAYQIWAFMAPGLTRTERRYVVALVPGATISFVVGALFAYFALMPPALGFLLGFRDPLVEVVPTVDSYISFISHLLIATGVIFELPLAMFFLAKIHLVNAKLLNSIRRYEIVAAFVIAAVVTPTPDPFNQLLVALPIMVLYEIGVLLTRFA